MNQSRARALSISMSTSTSTLASCPCAHGRKNAPPNRSQIVRKGEAVRRFHKTNIIMDTCNDDDDGDDGGRDRSSPLL